MPGMYNHCDQGYSSGTTVCAVERNNKKIEAKSVKEVDSLFHPKVRWGEDSK